MKNINPERARLGKIFEDTIRRLKGCPDVTTSGPATKAGFTPVTELPVTFIVRTWRHREEGDYIFLEYIGPDDNIRLCLPPEVAECMARQRDILTTKNRKRAAKAEAARRKAEGIQPAFLKARAEGE
jgi:hypothetical protein